jgi:hypothetical protein
MRNKPSVGARLVRLLITGIPGTGKTTFGNKLAKQGFTHYDFENLTTLNSFAADPAGFTRQVLSVSGGVVITWGFPPDAGAIALVLKLKNSGFKLIWLDGNRPAALRAFRKRNTVPEKLFYWQMYRIEESNVIKAIEPKIIDPFNDHDEFRGFAEMLAKMTS